MRLLEPQGLSRRQIHPGLVGYGDEADNTVVELTHNWDIKSYEHGTAFGHLAVGVDDIYKTCAELKHQGVEGHARARPDEIRATVIAFVEDPNGYKIELIERK